MMITLKSPAAGHSAGDTANVPNDYARWLIEQGYAIEANAQHNESENENVSSSATRTRRTKRTEAKVTQGDDDAESRRRGGG